jgi:deoxyhypusine synthase
MQVLVTSAGGVEEDIVKCLKPFVVGTFEANGEQLFDRGICRIGNIFVPNDRYLYFEKKLQPFFDQILKKQKELGRAVEVNEFVRELGLFINDENSVLYWCAKNNIPVFCPAIMDGSLGDLIYFFKQSHKEFQLDVTGDGKKIVDIAINCDKTGVILLGASSPKHFTLNANIFRDGADYAVYINTSSDFDGSDSGARIDEAITWGKVKPHAPAVKIHADATIVFPIIIASTFAKDFHSKKGDHGKA